MKGKHGELLDFAISKCSYVSCREGPTVSEACEVFPVVFIKKTELERILSPHSPPPHPKSNIDVFCMVRDPSQVNLRKQKCLD